MVRSRGLHWVPAIVAAVIWGQPAAALAASPYPVNVHVVSHQAVEFDPGWLFDGAPCFVALGDLTEVFNAEGHALATGIDADGNFVPPMHVQQTVEESILFAPYNTALPTYTGHATVHTTNDENSPHAGFTNTVILTGTDGSHLLFHEDLHILVKASGVVLAVDHQHAQC
jgi:hypothetical protein